MNFLKPALSITFALSMLAGASVLDAARADDLDVIRHTVPAPSIDPSTIIYVGDGKWCRIHPTGDLWVCNQELPTGGGTGTGTPDPTPAEKEANIEAHWTKPTPPCEPKGGETTGTGEGSRGGFRKS